MSASDVSHDFAEPILADGPQDPVTPRPAPPKRRRGGDGLPERIEVRLNQPLPPPPAYGYKDRRHQGKRGRADEGHEREPVSATTTEDNRMQLTQYIARLADAEDAQLRDDDLFDMSFVLVRDLRDNRNQVIGILVECGVAMPLKQTYYATLIGLLAKNDATIASDVADCISDRLKQAISIAEERTVRMYLHFLSCLVDVNVIAADDLIANLVELVKLGIEAGPGSDQGDWAAYTSISVLARSNHRVFAEETVWNSLRDYFLGRSEVPGVLPSVARLSCLRPEFVSDFRLNRDPLQMAYTELLDAKASEKPGARLHTIRMPDARITDPLKKCQPCSFSFRLSSLGTCGLGWLSPCRMLIDTDGNHDQLKEGLTGLDAFIFEQQTIDQLYIWHEGGRESLMMLTERALQLHAQQMLMETLLSHIVDPNPCRLPAIYWRGLTVWALRTCPPMAAFLGRSVHKIFQNIHKLTLDGLERLAIWFGYHLSNTAFEWPWAAWELVASRPDCSHPQRYFVEMALHQGVRLTYYDCVDSMLSATPALRVLLPPPLHVPSFDVPDEEHRNFVCSLIQQKAPFSDILECTRNDLEFAIKCVLWHGQKTYSHLFSRLRLYESDIGGALQALENPSQFISWVADFWSQSSQHVFIIVDRFLRHFILNPDHIVSWVFSVYGSTKLSDHDLFRILHNAIDFAQDHFDDMMLSDVLILTIQNFSQLSISFPDKSDAILDRFQIFIRLFPRSISRFHAVTASEAFIEECANLQSLFTEESKIMKKCFPQPIETKIEMEEDNYNSE